MDFLEERIIRIGTYISENNATVRDAARHFGVSKSTVHKDMTDKLKRYSPTLYAQVRAVLDKNKAERHMRGGEATKEKYRKMHAKPTARTRGKQGRA